MLEAYEAWAPLRPLMGKFGLEAVLLNSYQSVSYFAETNILSQVVLPDRMTFLFTTRKGASIVTSDIEASQVRRDSRIAQVYEYAEFWQAPVERLAELITSLHLGNARIGYESRRLPAESFERFRTLLPGVHLVPLDDAIEDAQSVKREPVRQMLAEAARATQAAIERCARWAEPSGTELDLAAGIVADLMRAGGKTEFCFVGSGKRALVGHPEPSKTTIGIGEIWRVDAGARFAGGLMSDIARTGVAGEPSARQRQTFAVVREAQQAAFEAIRPGEPASSVFLAVAAMFEAHGKPWRAPHVGHGLGIGIHEAPILAPTNQTVFEPGMVLAIEPFLLDQEHQEAYHTEDLVVVTDEGCGLLTTPQIGLLPLGGR